VQRGLFRLWIIFSCLFVIAVGVTSSGVIRRQFRIADEVEKGKTRIKRSGILILPCSSLRRASSDYWEQNGRCWYDTAKFRAQHTEYKDFNDDQLFDRFCEHAGITMALAFRPWATVMQAAGIAVGVPVAVLILGWSLLCAHAGFWPPQLPAR
jgi:hypothetical protein